MTTGLDISFCFPVTSIEMERKSKEKEKLEGMCRQEDFYTTHCFVTSSVSSVKDQS